jgi:hypothetical protein
MVRLWQPRYIAALDQIAQVSVFCRRGAFKVKVQNAPYACELTSLLKCGPQHYVKTGAKLPFELEIHGRGISRHRPEILRPRPQALRGRAIERERAAFARV